MSGHTTRGRAINIVIDAVMRALMTESLSLARMSGISLNLSLIYKRYFPTFDRRMVVRFVITITGLPSYIKF
ncbi:MAG: hypothetical protein QXI38_04715 [Conexivisphaerales archaeon]